MRSNCFHRNLICDTGWTGFSSPRIVLVASTKLPKMNWDRVSVINMQIPDQNPE